MAFIWWAALLESEGSLPGSKEGLLREREMELETQRGKISGGLLGRYP